MARTEAQMGTWFPFVESSDVLPRPTTGVSAGVAAYSEHSLLGPQATPQ